MDDSSVSTSLRMLLDHKASSEDTLGSKTNCEPAALACWLELLHAISSQYCSMRYPRSTEHATNSIKLNTSKVRHKSQHTSHDLVNSVAGQCATRCREESIEFWAGHSQEDRPNSKRIDGSNSLSGGDGTHGDRHHPESWDKGDALTMVDPSLNVLPRGDRLPRCCEASGSSCVWANLQKAGGFGREC